MAGRPHLESVFTKIVRNQTESTAQNGLINADQTRIIDSNVMKTNAHNWGQLKPTNQLKSMDNNKDGFKLLINGGLLYF